MKKIASFLATLMLASLTSIAPSLAADDWPSVSQPSWFAESGIQGIRLGQWLPCDPKWSSTNDCIQSLSWSKTDGTKIGDSTFLPNPNFDPFTAKQIWETAKTPDGATIDNYSHFVNTRAGTWKLPANLFNSDGSDEIYVEAHVMSAGLQFRVIPNSNGDLPKDVVATISLKSQNYSKYAGWVLSNTKNPSVTVNADNVTISGSPVVTPFADGADGLTCSSNTKKAAGSQSMIQINVFMDANKRINAGDAILGTNGVQCFTGVYFDPNTKQLVVGVGNVHFDIDGKPLQGWFDLKIKGSRAREWWGLEASTAVKSVQVQVVYEDGTSVIATTKADYDKNSDWITLASQGYHYSSPTLRVSFGKSTLKSTITCIKGKMTKSVTGVKPTCPSGYKKK